MKYIVFRKQIRHTSHVVMAENEASKLCSKQTTKRGKFSRKDKKQVKQTKSAVQPRLPKTASEVSSNWKALAAVSIDIKCSYDRIKI